MAAFDWPELFGEQMFKWQTAAIKLIVTKFCHMRTGIIWIQKLPFPFLKANKNNWVSWCYEACFTMIAARQKRAPYTLLLNFLTSEQTTNKQTNKQKLKTKKTANKYNKLASLALLHHRHAKLASNCYWKMLRKKTQSSNWSLDEQTDTSLFRTIKCFASNPLVS